MFSLIHYSFIYLLIDHFYIIDLCGEEVTGDYPHEEVGNRGVNHFPDGVFQKCRIIVMREREEERERLLRQRRMKNRNLLKTPNKKAVIPSDGFENFDTDEGNLLPFSSPAENAAPSPVGLLDKFDDQWNSIANAPGSPSNDQQQSLLSAALESDANGPTESTADYFQNLNTEPTTAAAASEPIQVTSPQQRRVNRPMRIQVPAGRGQGNVPASVRVATPGRGARR